MNVSNYDSHIYLKIPIPRYLSIRTANRSSLSWLRNLSPFLNISPLKAIYQFFCGYKVNVLTVFISANNEKSDNIFLHKVINHQS